MSVEFEQLVQRNQGRIRQIALRYAVRQDLDDVVQEICLALWRSFKNFRGEAKEETWVYRVALNTAISRVRTSVRERKGVTVLQGMAPAQHGVSAGFSHADLLTNFLESLNEIDASILMMYLDGLSATDMEQVLGMAAGTITVRVNRIKNKFSDMYID